MIKEKLINEYKIYRKNNDINHYAINRLPFNVIDEIHKETSFCPEDTSLYIRIKCIILNDLKQHPKCPICSEPLPTSNRGTELKETCGKECAGKLKSITGKKTNLDKYGVESFTLTETFKEKSSTTKIKRYGDSDYVKTENFKEKSRKTKLEKYGIDNYVNPDKMMETKLEKYGESLGYNPEKYKATCLERYNVEHVMQVPEIFEKQQSKLYKAGYFEHLIYRSTYEKYLLDLMKEKQLLNHLSNAFGIKYTFDNINRTYYPDYVLDYKNEKMIIEIKSTWTYDNCGKDLELKAKNDAKFNAVSTMNDYKFVLLMSKEDIKSFVKTLD